MSLTHRHTTSIKPGLDHCLVRDQDWERRPTTTTTWHPSRRRPSPMAAMTMRCPLNQLRNQDWERRPSWAQHRGNNSHNMADREVDNTDDHRHRAPNSFHRWGDRRRREVPTTATSTNVRTKEIENDVIEPRPRNSGKLSTDAWSVPSCTDDFNKWTNQLKFFFY